MDLAELAGWARALADTVQRTDTAVDARARAPRLR